MNTLFLFVTAAGSAPLAADLVRGALADGWKTNTVLTPNVSMVLPPEQIHNIPGNNGIRQYGGLDYFPIGTMLVAPCTFNTLNKLALGIADNLATAMIADAIGAGCPVYIAPSLNAGLWNHPQTALSLQRLSNWGCICIPPVVGDGVVTMAPVEVILERIGQRIRR